ncbi:MAG: MFS transporter [Zhenhengia sp.]|uniref:MFS transporter n=1 Tax=Zhenhengia sp. TaxID=2944208 RepID=UPI0039952E94
MQMQWGKLRLSFILVSLSFGVISFLLPIYSKTLGLSAIEIGEMFSILSLTVLISKPIIGRCTDKIGWKWFLVIGMSVYAVAFYILAGAKSTWILYEARILQGIGSAFLGIATYSMSVSIADEDKVGQQMGRVQSARSTGIMIGAVICFFIIGNIEFLIGWYKLFMIYALLAGVGALLIVLRVKEDTKAPSKDMYCRSRIKYSKDMVGLVIITFLLSLSFSMLSPILMVYLQDYVTTDLMGLSVAFIPSCIIYSVLGGRLGQLGDQYGHVKIMVVGICISCMVTFLIPSTKSLVLLAVLWCLDAVGGILDGTSRSAFQSKIVESSIKGEVYGIYSVVGGVGAIIGPIIGGVLYDKVSITAPFYTNGIVLIIACFVAPLIFNGNKPKKVIHLLK